MKKYLLMMLMCSTCAFAEDGGLSLSDGFVFGQKLEAPLVETSDTEPTWENNVYKINGYENFDEVDVVVSAISKTVISIRARKKMDTDADEDFAYDLIRSLEAKYDGEALLGDTIPLGYTGWGEIFGKCISEHSVEQCRPVPDYRFIKFFEDYALTIWFSDYFNELNFKMTFKEDSEKEKIYDELFWDEQARWSKRTDQEFLKSKGEDLLDSLR